MLSGACTLQEVLCRTYLVEERMRQDNNFHDIAFYHQTSERGREWSQCDSYHFIDNKACLETRSISAEYTMLLMFVKVNHILKCERWTFRNAKYFNIVLFRSFAVHILLKLVYYSMKVWCSKKSWSFRTPSILFVVFFFYGLLGNSPIISTCARSFWLIHPLAIRNW